MPAVPAVLAGLLEQHSCLRVLTLDRVGLEAALAAGIAAAVGELVVAIGLGEGHPVVQIPHLIAELPRTDIVFGRRKRVGWWHAWQLLRGLPKRWLLGPEVRTPPIACFGRPGAEAVAGFESVPGTARFLPWMAAMDRGYRVREIPVRLQPGASIGP